MYIENIEKKVVIIMRNLYIVGEIFQSASNERHLIVMPKNFFFVNTLKVGNSGNFLFDLLMVYLQSLSHDLYTVLPEPCIDIYTCNTQIYV